MIPAAVKQNSMAIRCFFIKYTYTTSETIHVLEDNGTFGTLTLTGNNTVDVAEMTSDLSTTERLT